jgi:hypothetical protein
MSKGLLFCYTIDMTSYEKIYELAADNYGFVTTKEAASVGVPKREMAALAKRNRLVRHGYGVYRLATHYLPTEYDGYAEAVLLAGDGAAVWGESVLAMHDLALVNPPQIHVSTNRRVRRTLPAWIKLTNRTSGEIDYYHGIPCQSLADAFRSCKGAVMRERLLEAVKDAQEKGLLKLGEIDCLIKELDYE